MPAPSRYTTAGSLGDGDAGGGPGTASRRVSVVDKRVPLALAGEWFVGATSTQDRQPTARKALSLGVPAGHP
ncbi:hypothetical protein GCM10023340_10020 [Nocardioides marinquilinus]|uniref:Uncharacterized protein n=1 Tax=Nocardioides marinquilinus TaxID=1210400 RepID=A0ABP9PC72_9ACTN